MLSSKKVDYATINRLIEIDDYFNIQGITNPPSDGFNWPIVFFVIDI